MINRAMKRLINAIWIFISFVKIIGAGRRLEKQGR